MIDKQTLIDKLNTKAQTLEQAADQVNTLCVAIDDKFNSYAGVSSKEAETIIYKLDHLLNYDNHLYEIETATNDIMCLLRDITLSYPGVILDKHYLLFAPSYKIKILRDLEKRIRRIERFFSEHERKFRFSLDEYDYHISEIANTYELDTIQGEVYNVMELIKSEKDRCYLPRKQFTY